MDLSGDKSADALEQLRIRNIRLEEELRRLKNGASSELK